MPELGKAVYRVVLDSTAYDAGMARVEARAATASKSIMGSLGRAEASMKRLGATMGAVGKRAEHVGGVMTRGLTVPLLLVGGAAVKMSVDFEDAMVKLQSLVGLSRREVAAFNDEVLELAKTLPQSPKELADALFFVTSAGFRGADAMKVLKAAAQAAATGLGDMTIIARAVGGAVNAYGKEALSATQATDTMIAAVTQGMLAPEELAGALGRVMGVAERLGVSFDQVTGSLAALSRFYVDASEGATMLRGIFQTLIKGGRRTEEQLKKVGLSLEEVRQSIRERGLLETLVLLRDHIGDNIAAWGKLFPNVRGLGGALLLTGKNLDATRGVLKATAESAGNLTRAMRTARETVGFKWRTALTSLQVAFIKLGDAVGPTVTQIAQHIERGANAFERWWGGISPETKKMVVRIAGLAAAAGPAAFAIGKLVRLVGLLVTGAALLVTPLGAVTAAFVLLAVKSEWFRKVLGSIVGFFKEHPGLGGLAALSALSAALVLVRGRAVAMAATMATTVPAGMAASTVAVGRLSRAFSVGLVGAIALAAFELDHLMDKLGEGIPSPFELTGKQKKRSQQQIIRQYKEFRAQGLSYQQALSKLSALHSGMNVGEILEKFIAGQSAVGGRTPYVPPSPLPAPVFDVAPGKGKPGLGSRAWRRLQLALVRAERSEGTADDLRILQQQEAFLRDLLRNRKLSLAKRMEIEQELTSVVGQIRSTNEDITDAAGAIDVFVPIIPLEMQRRFLEAQLTKSLKDDKRELVRQRKYLRGLLRNRDLELQRRIEILQELISVTNQLASVNEQITGEAGRGKDAEMMAALALRGTIFAEFASSIFHRLAGGGLAMGADVGGGETTNNKTMTYNQSNTFYEIPKDRYKTARQFQVAAQGAMG